MMAVSRNLMALQLDTKYGHVYNDQQNLVKIIT